MFWAGEAGLMPRLREMMATLKRSDDVMEGFDDVYAAAMPKSETISRDGVNECLSPISLCQASCVS